MLTIDIRRRFAGFHLEVAHAFPLGGITALFGPSGCGKSTLLRVIAGLDAGAEGSVRFGGEAWQEGRRRLAPHRRGVGYVFQEARLFPHLDVAGNLRYAERRARAVPGRAFGFDDVVSALDLGPLLARRTGALSGGERQRVSIGRTLLARPRLMLMDEPLAALDMRRKAGILPHIARLPEVFGVPVIYVTHAIDEVTQLADRMVVLSDGRKTAEGPVDDVLARLDLPPATGRFEAGAVAEARILGHDRGWNLTRLEVGGQVLEMPEVDLPEGTVVRLRVRARDVSLATERPRGVSIRNILEATVLEIAAEAQTAFAEILISVGGVRLRARLTRASVADLGLTPGSAVFALIKSVSFDRRALVPAGTGEADGEGTGPGTGHP
ncbi:molybdenum ABC transporter ATP-binding protein [Paroceanicella profunda]|uniref:Molybdenum ABC transporter ATP-binding protein n=1 Tax=Paroceanicella profunda TaxID=2579971 RepID=A0A5B8FG12_9RHOB|nr:molybdenum ABC transporter ATP-binding protein [Paroceanicella profunda]QDL90651.1 molybdenum ABC transporter ATP-binding protein [Paroceanicella profunda]